MTPEEATAAIAKAALPLFSSDSQSGDSEPEPEQLNYLGGEAHAAAALRRLILQNQYYEGWASPRAERIRRNFAIGVCASIVLLWLGFGFFVWSDKAPGVPVATAAMVGALSAITIALGVGVMRYILVNPWVPHRPLALIDNSKDKSKE